MIMKEIREALLDEGSILNKELTFIGAAESTRQVDETKQAEVQEFLLKFKASDRELDREKRVQHYERERDIKYKRKLDEWLQREEQKSAPKNRTPAKPSKVDLSLPEEISELIATYANSDEVLCAIEKDLQYDIAGEKKKKKRDPRGWQRKLDDRRKLRQQEKDQDAQDIIKERAEILELERQRQEAEERERKARQLEEERQEALKMKKFIEMQHEIERKEKQALEVVRHEQQKKQL